MKLDGSNPFNTPKWQPPSELIEGAVEVCLCVCSWVSPCVCVVESKQQIQIKVQYLCMYPRARPLIYWIGITNNSHSPPIDTLCTHTPATTETPNNKGSILCVWDEEKFRSFQMPYFARVVNFCRRWKLGLWTFLVMFAYPQETCTCFESCYYYICADSEAAVGKIWQARKSEEKCRKASSVVTDGTHHCLPSKREPITVTTALKKIILSIY